jgi:hypothetical protein
LAETAAALPVMGSERRARVAALATYWPLGLIVVVGAFLRWFSAGRIALWRDEAQYVAIARLPDFGAITRFLYENESHPPLFYYLGRAAQALFGEVEAPMSAFSLACSIAAIFLVHHIASAAFSRGAGILAAAGTALSIPLTVYSVQLRPYAFLSVLFLISHAALWRYWTGRSRGALLTWAGAGVLAIYTHYVTVLVLAGQALVIGWLLWRSPLGRRDARALILAAAGAFVLSLPAVWLLAHQAQTTSYPGLRPLQLLGPPRILLGMALNFPFEVGLPLILGAALLIGFRRGPSAGDSLLTNAKLILLAPVPLFLLFATIATYRSQFLTPHVVLSIVPLGCILFGGYVAQRHAEGSRWGAAAWFEGGLVLATLTAMGGFGYSKTTIDLVAKAVAAEAEPSDLLFLSPGVVGASFNRYYLEPNSQVNYPYAGRLELYPFAHDFDRVASTEAFQMGLDSIHAAYRAGRRVWFIADARWLRADLPAPTVLSRDSFGGIGQADRARVNRFDRYLRWLYGRPVMQVGAKHHGSGPEAFSAWLFARADSALDPATQGIQ